MPITTVPNTLPPSSQSSPWGPGIASHRAQAWGLVLGVAIGILVGESALFIPSPALAMAIGVFVSMMIASSFGIGPVMPIQAGVSVLLVLTLGPDTGVMSAWSTS